MTPDEYHEDELSRLLAAVRADADPVLWTRVRARLEARRKERAAGWLAWAMRPAALGASLAVFAAAVAVSAALIASAPYALPLGSADNLTEALLADLGGTAAAGPAAPGAAGRAAPLPSSTADSGEVR